MPVDLIAPSDLPPIPGLIFRHIHTQDDADAVYALRAACVECDHVDLLSTSEGLPSRDDMRAAFASVIAAQQHDRRLMAEVDGQLVGYTLIEPWYEEDGRWVYLILGWTMPAWRGRGISTAMLHWGEETSRRLAAADHPNQPFEFAANANSTQPDATALLLNEGYYVGYTVLEMGLDFAAIPRISPLPPGVEVRPARPEHIPFIAQSMYEAYLNEYAGHRFQGTDSLQESADRLSAPRQNPELWQVTWAGEQVVGIVLPLIEKGRAEMYDISVRPGWRRQGLARALLTRSLWDLRERGVRVIRLNTVAEFPTRARDLYASVGFRLLKEFPRYRKSPPPPSRHLVRRASGHPKS